ncbi:uncharacterized protein TM35_000271330 [Trypanosoma theileri]|uniref:Endonuclease/exonuclease/phosphatase domain-containing protein n=1 Tax=Trypanosoma theileri TaxID=67003 RepID=A0A1X0NPZ1_9TRYP|nr:uncharacterized protein TM35_000271330 [Trypanosoma theileri]ORC86543.1 hypothetical protein TM35_000271330 [Trypanosoma theileri]
MSEGLPLTVASAYFPPGRTCATSPLDTLLARSGTHLIGADANAHAMAWYRAISPDTRGDVLVQWCLDNDYVIHNTGDCTRHTTRHGLSAPDVTLSRECRLESWTASFSPDSDHYITPFGVVVGDGDDEPLRFPRPRAPIYAWKKAKWPRFRQMSNAQCSKRLKEKMSVHKRERLLTSAIRIATAAAVPRGGRDTTPFWTPELEEIEGKIHNCKPSVSRDRLVARRRKCYDKHPIRDGKPSVITWPWQTAAVGTF